MCTHEKESIQLGFQVKKWRLHIIQFMRWEYFLLTSLWLQQLALIIWIVQTQNRCTRTKSIQIWKQTTNYKLNFFPFAFLCLLLFQQTFYNSYQPSIFSNTDNFEAIFVSGFRITNETTEWENSNSEFTLFFFSRVCSIFSCIHDLNFVFNFLLLVLNSESVSESEGEATWSTRRSVFSTRWSQKVAVGKHPCRYNFQVFQERIQVT